MKITKRNSSVVEYDGTKIINAMLSANQDVEGKKRISRESAEKVEQRIHNKLESGKLEKTVETIQDAVIVQLILDGFYDLALAYAEYRYERQWVRHANTTDDGILGLIANTNKETMEENSNKDAFIVSTQRDLIAGEVSKDLSKRVLLPQKIVEAMEEGAIHFHEKIVA